MAARLFPVLTGAGGARAKTDVYSPALASMLAARAQRMAICNMVADCVLHAAIWRSAERELLAQNIAEEGRAAIAADDTLRAQAWREVDGVNSILDVYGLHQPPRYPEIDGPVRAVDGKSEDRNTEVAMVLSPATSNDIAALDPSIGLALALLDANDRDQAVRYEPLDASLNGPALARARAIDWSKYRYTAIIIPGVGPDDLDTPLSAAGKLNVRLAATAFADGVAPFIIVTGSAVHPRGTRFAEAIEMRRALIERYAIPLEDIVVEPYARHTTTNLRNATRRLIALGAPLDRDTLIVTNIRQSAYIEGAEFAARNARELGYQPGEIGHRLSPNALLFRPSSASARIDPRDPLDP